MKILLDECVTKLLKPLLVGHEVHTVRGMGWGGLKNGKLMAKCIERNFEVLLTIDKNILHQQNLGKYDLAIVVFDAENSKISTLEYFIAPFQNMAKSFEKGKGYLIQL